MTIHILTLAWYRTDRLTDEQKRKILRDGTKVCVPINADCAVEAMTFENNLYFFDKKNSPKTVKEEIGNRIEDALGLPNLDRSVVASTGTR